MEKGKLTEYVERPLDDFVKRTIDALLSILEDPKVEAKARLTAAHVIDDFNDTIVKAREMAKITPLMEKSANLIERQANSLGRKKKVWEEGYDEAVDGD